MAQIVAINKQVAALRRVEKAQLAEDPAYARARQQARELLVQPGLWLVQHESLSLRLASELMVARAGTGKMPPEWLSAYAEQGKPSAVTLAKWMSAYQKEGADGLKDGRRGKGRKVLGCEALILRLWQQGSQPTPGTISFWLKRDHDLDVPDWWIRRYLKSLPSNLAETSPARLGQHYYDQNIRAHKRRSFDDVGVGEAWVSDGHRFKAFVYHPVTGRLFRPEVTVMVDVRSNAILGWWMAAAESAMDTVYCFCRTMLLHDTMPVWLHTDPGPGFDNKRFQSLLIQIGTQHVITRAGNARGKGFGEGVFRRVIETFTKGYDTFSGDDRTDDALARMQTKVKRGELVAPTFEQFREDFAKWVAAYNAWPQKGSARLEGKAPADLLPQFVRNPLTMPVTDLLRPFKLCTVQGWGVRLNNRYYEDGTLKQYERRKVVVQFDEHDESAVWVRDSKHRLICIAKLVRKIGWATESAAADAREKSRRAAITLKERAIDEINDRARLPLGLVDTGSLLAIGHSFNPPLQGEVARAPLTAIPVDPVVMAALREQMAEHNAPSDIPDNPRERYALWKRLVAEGQRTEWMTTYETLSEWHSARLIEDSFNTE